MQRDFFTLQTHTPGEPLKEFLRRQIMYYYALSIMLFNELLHHYFFLSHFLSTKPQITLTHTKKKKTLIPARLSLPGVYFEMSPSCVVTLGGHKPPQWTNGKRERHDWHLGDDTPRPSCHGARKIKISTRCEEAGGRGAARLNAL